MTPEAEARIRAAFADLADAVVDAVSERETRSGPERLLSVDEAAEALGIGRSRIYQEIGAGHLRSCKAGRRRLIPARAVAEFSA